MALGIGRVAVLHTTPTSAQNRPAESGRSRPGANVAVNSAGPRPGARADQRAQRLVADQRDVAVEHQHGAPGRRGQRLQNAVAGAQLFVLVHPVDRVGRQLSPPVRRRVPSPVTLAEAKGGGNDMFQQRPARQRMQHLG